MKIATLRQLFFVSCLVRVLPVCLVLLIGTSCKDDETGMRDEIIISVNNGNQIKLTVRQPINYDIYENCAFSIFRIASDKGPDYRQCAIVINDCNLLTQAMPYTAKDFVIHYSEGNGAPHYFSNSSMDVAYVKVLKIDDKAIKGNFFGRLYEQDHESDMSRSIEVEGNFEVPLKK